MLRRKRILIITLVVLFVGFLIYQLGDIFSPGSYSKAETYQLDYKELDVIDALKRLKKDNRDFQVPIVTVPNGASFSLDDERNEKWFKFYFYYKDENQILLTLTRPSGKESTTLYFVSINEGLEIGNWKDVNEDFDFLENKKLKETFESRILSELIKILKSKD